MFHLTPQEKMVIRGLCLIILVGTLINIALQRQIKVFNWLATSKTTARVTAIDINRATSEDLLRVPGIGPKTAAYILAYRQMNGHFTSLEPLRQAKGMSAQRYERLIQYLKIQR